MCHNVIDGRFHEPCRHFKAMSTRRQDCLTHDCFFSNRHPAECCRGACRCKRMMDPPFLNAIRLSPNPCPDCALASALAQKERTCS